MSIREGGQMMDNEILVMDLAINIPEHQARAHKAQKIKNIARPGANYGVGSVRKFQPAR